MADAEFILLVEEAAEGGHTTRALGHAIHHTEADTLALPRNVSGRR